VQRASRTVPVVLAQSIDPVGAGFVASLARPGGSLAGIPDGASIGDDRHCAAGITVKRMHQHTRIRCDRAFYPA
jgi:ABC-type uncharacterized transport system substrate-binding protein